jgi:hypothetical protein
MIAELDLVLAELCQQEPDERVAVGRSRRADLDVHGRQQVSLRCVRGAAGFTLPL